MADAEVADAATAAPEPVYTNRQLGEMRSLHQSARGLAVLLSVVCVATFLGGRVAIDGNVGIAQLLGVALIGMAGSGLGALSSLLARYASGLKLEDGTTSPPAAEGELYDRRIAFAMLMRPVLGVLIAPLLVAGVALFFKQHEDFKGSVDAITVVAFVGGLYAKSVIETAKNLFKAVFRA